MKVKKFITISSITLAVLLGSIPEGKAGPEDERNCIQKCGKETCKKTGGLLSKGAEWCIKTCSYFIGRPGLTDAHLAISDCLDSVSKMPPKDRDAMYKVLKNVCPTCPQTLGGVKADKSGVIQF